MAVTKGFGAEAIESALAAGLRDIGENYYQEAAEKFRSVRGPRVSNAILSAASSATKPGGLPRSSTSFRRSMTWRSPGRSTAEPPRRSKALDVFVQVNVAGDERQGVPPDLLLDFVRTLARASPPACARSHGDGSDRRTGHRGGFCSRRGVLERLRSLVGRMRRFSRWA